MAYIIHADETPFYVGSINIPGPWLHASGEGLTRCAINETTGVLRRLEIYPQAENAIWLCAAKRGLIVATERYLSNGEISSFSISDNGKLTRIGPIQNSHGGAICHITTGSDNDTIFTASFLGGLSVHGMNTHGEISSAHQTISYQGHGPGPMQERSHPHQITVSPDGEFLYVCDLGSDRIWIHPIYKKDQKTVLGKAIEVGVLRGSGPRHLVFHPTLPLLYLLGQLDGHVRIYQYKRADMDLKGVVDALPDNFSGESSAAAIRLHPSGKTLYVSERSSSTITAFKINADGKLTRAFCFETAGDSPRDFNISPSGRWLIALNHGTDSIVSFQLDPESGFLTSESQQSLSLGCPVCILFN